MRLFAPLTVLLGAMFLLLAPQRALAFGDCRQEGYLSSFDRRLSRPQSCTYYDLRGLNINGHPSLVRAAVLDADTNRGVEAWIDEINQTLDDISFAASALGPNLRVQDITILLTSMEYRDPTGLSHAVTFAGRAAMATECPITFYKLPEAVPTADFAATLAHEVFHCIQYATWQQSQSRRDAAWWTEGSAEYFGALVVPASNSTLPFAQDFPAHANDVSMYDEPLDYENVAFFSWLHQTGGGDAVVGFLDQMPAAEEFLPVLQRLLPAPRWMEFAQTLIEGEVRVPGGEAINPGDPMQYILLEGDSGSPEIPVGPFQLKRIALRADQPGHYEITVSGDDVLAKLRIGKDEWHDLPHEISTCRDYGGAELVLVTTEATAEAEIHYQRSGECADCERQSARTACLPGTWTLTEGGPVEWMRAQGIDRKIHVEAGQMRIRIKANGTYEMLPVTADAITDDGEIKGRAQSLGLSGFWSDQNGVLAICPRGGDIDLKASVHGHTRQLLFGPGGDALMNYECHGDRLTTTMEFPHGMPPMVSTYSRSAP